MAVGLECEAAAKPRLHRYHGLDFRGEFGFDVVTLQTNLGGFINGPAQLHLVALGHPHGAKATGGVDIPADGSPLQPQFDDSSAESPSGTVVTTMPTPMNSTSAT